MEHFHALYGQHVTPSTGSVEHFHAIHGQCETCGTLPRLLQASWNTSTPSTGSMENFHILKGQRGTLPRPQGAACNTSTPYTGSVEHFHALHGQCGTLSCPQRASCRHRGTLPRPPRALWNTIPHPPWVAWNTSTLFYFAPLVSIDGQKFVFSHLQNAGLTVIMSFNAILDFFHALILIF